MQGLAEGVAQAGQGLKERVPHIYKVDELSAIVGFIKDSWKERFRQLTSWITSS
jgi:hypothetical protein